MKISTLKKELAAAARNNLEEARKAIKLVRERAKIAAPIHLALDKAMAGAGFTSTFAGASGKIYVSAYVNVDSFKSPVLIGALEAVLYRLPLAKMKTDDFPDSNLRAYRFTADDDAIDVVINATLKGEGNENCRRVEIGCEMVEVKKYKFVCDGEGLPA
jgi:hypothetical protein